MLDIKFIRDNVDLIKEKMPEAKAQALTQVIEILINFTIELQKGKNNAV